VDRQKAKNKEGDLRFNHQRPPVGEPKEGKSPPIGGELLRLRKLRDEEEDEEGSQKGGGAADSPPKRKASTRKNHPSERGPPENRKKEE